MMCNTYNSIALLIPAYNPTPALIDIARTVSSHVPCPIVIVDDGSNEACQYIFDEVNSSNNVFIVKNNANLGKGAAIKSGIGFILKELLNVTSVVTADADGQHSPEDIIKIIKESKIHPTSFILGARRFTKDVPFRSRLGNNISRIVYSIILGKKIEDTQTGLRSLPIDLARSSLNIASNRYEFETEQLALAARSGLNFIQVPIKTIYIDNNATSHFNPIVDSIRIYIALAKYALSSLLTSLVDLIVFIIVLPILNNVIYATLFGRTFAIFVQFFLLKEFVFSADAKLKHFTFFVIYVYTMGLVSGYLQIGLSYSAGFSPIPSKIIVESLIFVFNFFFLRQTIFSRVRS